MIEEVSAIPAYGFLTLHGKSRLERSRPLSDKGRPERQERLGILLHDGSKIFNAKLEYHGSAWEVRERPGPTKAMTHLT